MALWTRRDGHEIGGRRLRCGGYRPGRTAPPDGAIVIAITGDEEGPGRDGTIAILDWMAETVGERMDVCIVGEPTSRTEIGDMIKIGRRGFDDGARFEVIGKQGHSAYLHKALNPMPAWQSWRIACRPTSSTRVRSISIHLRSR
jgi:acetylornithine deacetylase/succinyl-diaminopimelate desuccinylase-like protein